MSRARAAGCVSWRPARRGGCRVPTQIESAGRAPSEMDREDSHGYSKFNDHVNEENFEEEARTVSGTAT